MLGPSCSFSVIATACLILSASVQGAVAQQSKTLGGRIIGEAEWQRITPAASEFDVTSPHHFMVRKKVFSQRYQERWTDQRSTRDGARLAVFYERLNVGSFTTSSYEQTFERLAVGLAGHFGTDVDDIRYEKLSRAFRLAYLPHGANHCAMGMRIFGVSQGGHTSFNGDRNIRVTVCKQGAPDDPLLKNLIIATVGSMRQDGRAPKLIGLEAQSYDNLSRELFSPTSTSQPGKTAPRDVVGWERRDIKIDWAGNPDLKTGTIFLRHDQTRGRILITVKGAFRQSNGGYNMDIGRSGAWNIVCTDGLKATGTFGNSPDGTTHGSGKDNNGAPIRFSIAPS